MCVPCLLLVTQLLSHLCLRAVHCVDSRQLCTDSCTALHVHMCEWHQLLQLTCRQEARRRLGNTGKVFLDFGSDEEEEDVQLQPPAGDGCARRVTFSAAGASAEEPQLQPGAEVGTSARLHASRWALSSFTCLA